MRGSVKGKLLLKIHLPTTVTKCWVPPKNPFHLIIVGNVDISSNGSYPSSSLNNLYESLNCYFHLSITWLIATSWENLILSFVLREGVISA